MKIKWLIYMLLFGLLSFEDDPCSDLIETEMSINLRWNKAYPDDTIDKSIVGLKWGLSYLGAVLPSSNSAFSATGNIITVKIEKLGFNKIAAQRLRQLIEKIKATPEYKVNNAVDLGRFITLVLGASQHYYQIIGTPQTLAEVLDNYTLLPQKGYADNSAVSHGARIVRFSGQAGFNQVFLSEELEPASGEIYEYETIELLSNGQLRFGIFDVEGNRKNNADALHSDAGKPAKCMWCHESNINHLFAPQNDRPGYLSYADFQNTLIGYRESNNKQKLALSDGVDFSQTQQHTLTELLYISFMEPSAERLSLEWNLSNTQVQALLSGLPTHVHNEFPFLGTLYERKDIEALAPALGLAVSSHVREESQDEVNYLND